MLAYWLTRIERAGTHLPTTRTECHVNYISAAGPKRLPNLELPSRFRRASIDQAMKPQPSPKRGASIRLRQGNARPRLAKTKAGPHGPTTPPSSARCHRNRRHMLDELSPQAPTSELGSKGYRLTHQSGINCSQTRPGPHDLPPTTAAKNMPVRFDAQPEATDRRHHDSKKRTGVQEQSQDECRFNEL